MSLQTSTLLFVKIAVIPDVSDVFSRFLRFDLVCAIFRLQLMMTEQPETVKFRQHIDIQTKYDHKTSTVSVCYRIQSVN